MRNRKRKTDIGLFTEESMKEAVDLVLKGSSIRQAAELKGVARNTLHRYVNKVKNANEDEVVRMTPNYKCRLVFQTEEENTLAEYLLTCSKMNYGLSTKDTRKLAYEMAVKNKKVFPASWNTTKLAGEDWLNGYMKRHPILSIRKPESCSLSRSTAFNKYNVKQFFDKLLAVYGRFSSFADGSRVYNLDETATSTVQKPKKVISQRGMKQVSQATSAERGCLVTTCCIINALGSPLPPVMVFPRMHFKSHMINDAPPGTLGLANPSGWMSSELFVEVMRHFIKFSCSSKDNPSLLIYDNHESHLSIEVIELARENGVTILTIHPHCSHKLQPLDVAVYASFKSHYYSAMDSRLLQRPGVPINIYDVAGLVNVAYQRSMTPSNIISGFRKTGIFPFDANIFNEDEFAPSAVTDRPDPETSSTSDLGSENFPRAGPSHELEPAFISPKMFWGYPKAQPRKKSNKGRKRGRTMVATDTPEKEALQDGRKIKKILKAKAIPRKLLYESDNESSNEAELPLSDHSSDELQEGTSTIIDPLNFKELDWDPKMHDYVLVEFDTDPKIYYIGKIMQPKDQEGDFEISYLRKKNKACQFVFPQAPDIASVKLHDIKVILPEPVICGKTQRQNSYIRFDANFDLVNLS